MMDVRGATLDQQHMLTLVEEHQLGGLRWRCLAAAATLAGQAGRVDQAVAAYTAAGEALSAHGQTARAAGLLGRSGVLLQRAGKTAEAQATLRAALRQQEALQCTSEALTTRLNLLIVSSGTPSEREKQLDDLERILERSSERGLPRSLLARTHYYRGELLTELGRAQEAQEAYGLSTRLLGADGLVELARSIEVVRHGGDDRTFTRLRPPPSAG